MPPVVAAVSPARQVAAAVLRRVESDGAYADRALAGEARRAGLDARDHAFAMALAFGAVQRRRTLDHVIERLARRPVGQLDPPVRDALRLGLLQLLFLGGVAPHAAVDQSVELAKAAGGPGYKLVNAVLRRGAREGPRILAQLDDRSPHGAALLHSVPDWIAALWWDALGAEEARALLARVNEPAETALRVNTLAADPAAVAAELGERGVAVRPAALEGIPLDEGLVVDSAFDVRSDPLFASGALVAQSRAAMAAARLLAPAPGARVLDLCAAPGGKATHLAALVGAAGAAGEVVAVERHEGRAEALRETCERLRAGGIVRVETGDAAQPRDPGDHFDAVLVDPPCSGLGTLQGRPDLRWRASAEAIGELSRLQGRILAAGAAALRPGGALLYATCTISPRENEQVVDAFLAAHDGFERVSTRQLTPSRDDTDGFFLALLRRSAP
ncbi:16S rRNA (cytosine(967)-C(5))-methyltransferase RsmB [Conexibacter woesei]|uniref:16S rRNA (cytosine(967)-C(5))-methyltransferase n=1 Tax=Conexibacter woesei (strain DSM 14684 / CCUG 47730 / CIP 108061 / JCM 11494 / NBRC 100937 / ID131577) TaxID=469383 RepID=D3F1H6_CONWI|nr:16S rRNA (cytosine(967)-C(5))-methyltransferase RsmB [Conexibacter woesei]ADB52139.1 sun protein [Conexibacter woesei DSM 14684]